RSQAYPVLNNLGVPQHWLHLGTSGEDLGRDGFVGLQRPIPRQGHATQYNGLTVWVDVALFRRRAGDLGEQLGKSRILDDDDLPSDRYHLPVWHKLSRARSGLISEQGGGGGLRWLGSGWAGPGPRPPHGRPAVTGTAKPGAVPRCQIEPRAVVGHGECPPAIAARGRLAPGRRG